jgi:putative membrane protein
MGYGYGPQWGMMNGGYGYGFGLGHMIVWIVILIVIIAVVVWLVRAVVSPAMHHLPPPRRSGGLDVLEERYARGEIGRDEYLQKKKDIGG